MVWHKSRLQTTGLGERGERERERERERAGKDGASRRVTREKMGGYYGTAAAVYSTVYAEARQSGKAPQTEPTTNRESMNDRRKEGGGKSNNNNAAALTGLGFVRSEQ